MTSRSRIAALAGLAVAFAAFLSLAVVLTGRLDAAGTVAALTLGSVGAAVFVAGRPIVAVRAMAPRARALACAGGLLAFFAAPAIVAGVRLSDAPAGSVVVFWIAGGWAALVALVGMVTAWRAGRAGSAAHAVAGAATALAGVGAIVANWERPSSFSPLVRFPGQEVAILAAGALFVAGGLMLVAAARRGGMGGVLACGAGAALLAALAWVVATGPAAAVSAVLELPVQVALAALAWGAVCALWPMALANEGPAASAAALVAAPLFISALTWIEQATGVAGPRPFAVPGLVAGVAIVVCAIVALGTAGRADGVTERRPAVRAAALIPLVAALVGLALPAILVSVTVTGSPAGTFSGSWLLPGAESLAGLAAVALGLVFAAAALARRDRLAPFVGAIASAACFLLLDVPTHVLNGWLSPGIQSYYGTEYGSIAFASVLNPALLAAVAAAGVGCTVLALLPPVSCAVPAAPERRRVPEV